MGIVEIAESKMQIMNNISGIESKLIRLRLQLTKLIEINEASTEYIKLLEEECGRLLILSTTHGYEADPDKIKQGEDLRKLLKELKGKI